MRTILALVVALLASCGTEPSEPDVDVDSYYTWHHTLMESVEDNGESWAEYVRGSWNAFPLERIRLELSETPFFSHLEIVFEHGGAASRTGGTSDWPSPDVASYTATLSSYEYAKLCWLHAKLDLPRASQAWSSPVFHGGGVRIECTTTKGEVLRLEDFAGACPPEVSAFAAAIELAARRLDWTPVDTALDTEAR